MTLSPRSGGSGCRFVTSRISHRPAHPVGQRFRVEHRAWPRTRQSPRRRLAVYTKPVVRERRRVGDGGHDAVSACIPIACSDRDVLREGLLSRSRSGHGRIRRNRGPRWLAGRCGTTRLIRVSRDRVGRVVRPQQRLLYAADRSASRGGDIASNASDVDVHHDPQPGRRDSGICDEDSVRVDQWPGQARGRQWLLPTARAAVDRTGAATAGVVRSRGTRDGRPVCPFTSGRFADPRLAGRSDGRDRSTDHLQPARPRIRCCEHRLHRVGNSGRPHLRDARRPGRCGDRRRPRRTTTPDG